MKFKIGDRVKVIDRNSKLRGVIGTVVQIHLPTIVVEIDAMKHSLPVAFSMNDLMPISKITYKSDDTKTMMASAGYTDTDECMKNHINSVYGMAGDYGRGGFTQMQMFYDKNIPERAMQSKIRNVYFNDPLTCVIWTDGTKTFVKNADGDHNYDPEKALAMAISKKALGNKHNYYKEFEKWLPKEDAKFSLKSLLEVSKELSKSLASFGATTKENYVNKRKMALTKNPVEKAYLTLLKVNDDPASKDADFAAAIEEAIGYLGEALDN